MVCPKCKNSAVLNEVLGKEFYYCRTCKDEVQLQSPQAIVNHIAKAPGLVQAPGSGPLNPPNWFVAPPLVPALVSPGVVQCYLARCNFMGARHTILRGSELHHSCVIFGHQGTPCSSARGQGWHLMTIKSNGAPDYSDQVSDFDLGNFCQPMTPTVP